MLCFLNMRLAFRVLTSIWYTRAVRVSFPRFCGVLPMEKLHHFQKGPANTDSKVITFDEIFE